jgi:DNA-directed RNA polymerase subunit RPC12/RpoP
MKRECPPLRSKTEAEMSTTLDVMATRETDEGLTEYACRCGHPFLLAARGLARVHHPLVCTASGHRVVFVERRDDYREHRCVDCGHTFGVAASGR